MSNTTIEITKEAAWALIGNDENTWSDYYQTELAEFSTYTCHGVKVVVIHNFTSQVTQYYVEDINA